MPLSLHHIIIDAHDLAGLSRFWAEVLDWKILSEREREVVIGTEATAPVGICFMPVTDTKVVKNRLHLDLAPGLLQTATLRSIGSSRWALDSSTSDRPAVSLGPCSPIRKATSSASYVRRKTSSSDAQEHRGDRTVLICREWCAGPASRFIRGQLVPL